MRDRLTMCCFIRRDLCADPDPDRILPGGMRHRKRDRAAATGPVWTWTARLHSALAGQSLLDTVAIGLLRACRRCGDRHALPDPVLRAVFEDVGYLPRWRS
jgi:hypothetical protein